MQCEDNEVIALEDLPVVSAAIEDRPLIKVARQGADTFSITEMSNLKLHYIFFCRFNYELTCDASWTMNTGKSSSQDRSRITGTIMPLMMKSCEPEDLHIVQSSKPETSTAQYETWRSELLRVSLKVEEKVRINLEAEEKEYLPPRNEKRKRDMCINGVMDRLKKVSNARKARTASVAPSIAMHFGNATSTPVASSSSASAIPSAATAVNIAQIEKSSKKKSSSTSSNVAYFVAKSN